MLGTTSCSILIRVLESGIAKYRLMSGVALAYPDGVVVVHCLLLQVLKRLRSVKLSFSPLYSTVGSVIDRNYGYF